MLWARANAADLGQAGHFAVVHGQFTQRRKAQGQPYAPGQPWLLCGRAVQARRRAAPARRARAAQVGGLGIGGRGGLDGGHAVCGRNTRGHARGGLDGDRKGRALRIGVVVCHHGQLKLQLHVLIGKAQANNAAAMANQHGHLRHGEVLRAKNEVAFIFRDFRHQRRRRRPYRSKVKRMPDALQWCQQRQRDNED